MLGERVPDGLTDKDGDADGDSEIAGERDDDGLNEETALVAGDLESVLQVVAPAENEPLTEEQAL